MTSFVLLELEFSDVAKTSSMFRVQPATLSGAATSFFIQLFVKCRIPDALRIIHFMEPQLFEN